jgi:hypothetical protein
MSSVRPWGSRRRTAERSSIPVGDPLACGPIARQRVNDPTPLPPPETQSIGGDSTHTKAPRTAGPVSPQVPAPTAHRSTGTVAHCPKTRSLRTHTTTPASPRHAATTLQSRSSLPRPSAHSTKPRHPAWSYIRYRKLRPHQRTSSAPSNSPGFAKPEDSPKAEGEFPTTAGRPPTGIGPTSIPNQDPRGNGTQAPGGHPAGEDWSAPGPRTPMFHVKH